MSLAKVVSKPAPPPAAKSDPAPASARDACAFAAKIKKASTEQQGRSARNARRDELATRAAKEVCEDSAVVRDMSELVVLAASQRQQQGNGDGESWSQIAISTPVEDADADFLVDQLAPLAAQDGMFEVLMPNGAKLAVAMSTSAQRVQILIGSDSANLSDQLKRKKMELEQRLGRRIGKDVVLAVL